MEITNLKQMTKEEVFNLIRQRLSFGDELQQQLRHVDKDKFMKEHRRFEMSGFETQTGWCTVFNNDILNKFADLGIYTSSISPKMRIWNTLSTDIQQQKSYLRFLN